MMTRSRFRILIADDDPIVCQFLRNAIDREQSMEVVGEASTGLQTLQYIEDLHPDAVTLDLLMPEMHGLEVMHGIRMKYVHVAVIILAASITRQQGLQAFQLGAQAVLRKHDVDKLIECLRAVSNGEYWARDKAFTTSADACLHLCDDLAPVGSNPWKVTNREMQIICLIASGKTNREIASLLTIREATVKRHVANIFEKCGVAHRVELVKFASTQNLSGGEFPAKVA